MSLTRERSRTILAIVLVSLIVVIFLLRLKNNVKTANLALNHGSQYTHQIIQLGNILSEITSIDAAANAYVLTGKTFHLISYRENLDSLARHKKELFNGSKNGNSNKLNDLLNQKVANTKSLIEIRDQFGRDSAVETLNKLNDALLMSSISIKADFLLKSLQNKISDSNKIRRRLVTVVATEFILFASLLILIIFFTYKTLLKEYRIRKKHEDVLEFNGALIRSIKDPIVTFTDKFIITNWNEYAEKLYGFRESEVLGKSIIEVLAIEIVNGEIKPMAEQLFTIGSWRGEMYQRTKKNQPIHASAAISRISTSEFKKAGFVAMFNNISSKKEMEKKLRLLTTNLEREVERKAAELNTVYDRITDAFFALDLDWNYTYLNKKAEELHGKTEAQLKGKNIFNVFKGVVDPNFFNSLREVRRTMQPIKNQIQLSKDGRWFENYIYPSADGISIYYHDITQEKNAELKLIYALEKLNSHINNTPLAVVEFNSAFEIINWSKKAEQIFGWTEDEVCNTNFTFFDLLYEEEANDLKSNFHSLLETKSSGVLQLKNINKWGDIVYCEWYNSILSKNEETLGVLSLVQDVSARKRMEVKLQQSEGKFKSLVEESLVGVYIAQNNKFTYVNPRFCEIYGFNSFEEIEGKFIVDFLGDEVSIAAARDFEIDHHKKSIHYEHELLNNAQQKIIVEVFGTYLKYNNDDSVIGTVIDVTDKSKIASQLKKVNERFTLVAKATNDAIWDWDIENDSLTGNERFYYLFGLENNSKLSFKEFHSKIHPEDKQRILINLENAFNEKIPFISELFRFRYLDDSYRYINDRAYIIYDSAGKAVRMLGAMQDVTERMQIEESLKSSHDQLRELAIHLQTVRESERMHISREIHDELGQQLTGLKMDIAWINKKIGSTDAEIKEKFNELFHLVDRSVKTVRRLSSQLRPSILDDLGLVAAMEWQSEEFQKRTRIKTTFISDVDSADIPPEISINIFRIYQESLTNVMRHANASSVVSTFFFRDNEITLIIRDNGAGFDQSKLGTTKTLGILGMNERTLMMNGKYDIKSEPGEGTTVVLTVPVNN